MKKLKISLLLLISISLLSACDTNDIQDVQFNGAGDVFVRCIKVGDETRYAPVFYSYSNENLSLTSVESPASEVPDYNLSDYSADKRVFRLLPNAADYSTDDVANGIYQFKLTSTKQETIQTQDKLLDSRIDPMVITDFTYTKEGHIFEIKWNELNHADTYVVKLMAEKDGLSYYISDRISATEYKFNQNSKNWAYNIQLTAGKTYWLGVFGYEFENSSIADGSNINCETVEYKEIVW
ncbi:hypothetical protein [Labilibaculum euxinus]